MNLKRIGVTVVQNWFVGDAAKRVMYSATVRTQNRNPQKHQMKRTMNPQIQQRVVVKG